MAYGFLDIAATPAVKHAQEANNSLALWENFAGDRASDRFTDRECSFIAERDSFYMASVSKTGWPYVQHRGGGRLDSSACWMIVRLALPISAAIANISVWAI